MPIETDETIAQTTNRLISIAEYEVGLVEADEGNFSEASYCVDDLHAWLDEGPTSVGDPAQAICDDLRERLDNYKAKV